MQSNIARELDGKFKPIVLIKTDDKPENAIGPKAGRGGCVMSFVAQTIAKEKSRYLVVKMRLVVESTRGSVGEAVLKMKKQLIFRPHFSHVVQIRLKIRMNT